MYCVWTSLQWTRTKGPILYTWFCSNTTAIKLRLDFDALLEGLSEFKPVLICICFKGSIIITSNWQGKVRSTNSNHGSKSSRNFTVGVFWQNQFYSIGPWSPDWPHRSPDHPSRRSWRPWTWSRPSSIRRSPEWETQSRAKPEDGQGFESRSWYHKQISV